VGQSHIIEEVDGGEGNKGGRAQLIVVDEVKIL
jgi:hypothetical protein